MNQSIIRLATMRDLNAYWLISIDTFAEAYADRNKPEDIAFYSNNYFSLKNIERELKDHLITIYVAEKDNHLTGYIKLKPSDEYGVKNALEIKRIYVRKEQYGSGLGNELMRCAYEHALSGKFDALTLAVWKENKRAISFYKKQGFIIYAETTFDWGTGKVDEDWVMIKSV